MTPASVAGWTEVVDSGQAEGAEGPMPDVDAHDRARGRGLGQQGRHRRCVREAEAAERASHLGAHEGAGGLEHARHHGDRADLVEAELLADHLEVRRGARDGEGPHRSHRQVLGAISVAEVDELGRGDGVGVDDAALAHRRPDAVEDGPSGDDGLPIRGGHRDLQPLGARLALDEPLTATSAETAQQAAARPPPPPMEMGRWATAACGPETSSGV